VQRILLPSILMFTAALAASLHAAPAKKLEHTRQVLKAIGLSFVGQPTREELLMGGLSALVRLSPGVTAHEDKHGVVTVTHGNKAFRFATEDMVADTEVAAALEKVGAAVAPKVSAVDLDDAIAGATVTALADRHSAYLRPFFMERLGFSDGEHLGDPGVDVKQVGQSVAIRSVSLGSSAAVAGVKEGEILRRVDSHNVEGLSLGEIGALLLGPSGTPVVLTLEPRGGGDPHTLSLQRDPPYALHPQVRVIDDVMHVVPGPLLGSAWKPVEVALRGRPASLKGVILDFRGNGGGQVGDAVELADLFVPEGPVAVLVGRANRPVQRFEARAGNVGEGLPVVMLVDARTASSSELVSLILRERLQSKLLGVQTYGKGSVQKLIPVAGGGYLKITSAMYSTSAGTTVGDGIVPDVVLDPALAPRRGQEGSMDTDPWLKAAHDAVTGKTAAAPAR